MKYNDKFILLMQSDRYEDMCNDIFCLQLINIAVKNVSGKCVE